jgi:hypothetical protein
MALFANGWDWICKIPKKNSLKINLNILTFYITSITFYHFSNKKITTKQKISLFYIKHSYFFSHINQICYSTNPLLPIQSLPKHNPCESSFFLHSFSLYSTLISKPSLSFVGSRSPHSLSLSPFLPLSLSPFLIRSRSLSLSASQNQKPQEPLSLSRTPSLAHPLSHYGHRRPPRLTLSLTPAQGFRSPAKKNRPCSPSLAPVSLSLRRKRPQPPPESSSNRKPQRKQNIPFITLTRERERRHRVRRERETRVTKPPSGEIHPHACCWCFTVSMHESSG